MYLSAHEGWIRFHRCLVMFSESQHTSTCARMVCLCRPAAYVRKKRGQKEAAACLYVVAKARQSQMDCSK